MTQKSFIIEKGNLRMNGITTQQMLKMLENKHSKDVIIPECKNGETWGARDLLKIDAWVLRRTYSPLTIIGYEIKAKRQDFESDNKWMKYLDLCHQFYFVCPSGLIREVDLPKRIGIIWATKNRLHTKRKAERIDPDIQKLFNLLIYVVMSRAKIVANMNETNNEEELDRLTNYRNILERAEERKELATFVRGHIQRWYQELRKTQASLHWRENNVKSFEGQLARLGIVWNSDNSNWEDRMYVEKQIAQLKEVIDLNTLNQLNMTAKNIISLTENLQRFYK